METQVFSKKYQLEKGDPGIWRLRGYHFSSRLARKSLQSLKQNSGEKKGHALENLPHEGSRGAGKGATSAQKKCAQNASAFRKKNGPSQSPICKNAPYSKYPFVSGYLKKKKKKKKKKHAWSLLLTRTKNGSMTNHYFG